MQESKTAMSPGFDPDKLDMTKLYQGEFKTAADALRSGQPVAPYFGKFHYTSKNTDYHPPAGLSDLRA